MTVWREAVIGTLCAIVAMFWLEYKQTHSPAAKDFRDSLCRQSAKLVAYYSQFPDPTLDEAKKLARYVRQTIEYCEEPSWP